MHLLLIKLLQNLENIILAPLECDILNAKKIFGSKQSPVYKVYQKRETDYDNILAY